MYSTQSIEAQIFTSKKKAKTEKSKKSKTKDKYEEKIKNAEKIEGLFTLYRVKAKGNLFLEIFQISICSKNLNYFQILHFSKNVKNMICQGC